MKKNIILFFLYFAYVQSNNSYAIGPSDTLLVYFSDNENINMQYFEMLELKFPQLNLVFISNNEEFNEYVPEKIYSLRTMGFGKENASHEAPSPQYNNGGYYFFDISSRKESGSYQISNPNGQFGTTTQYYTNTIHNLDLVYFNNGSLSSEKLKFLTMNESFTRSIKIPLGNMHSSSDWINPVYAAMFLAGKMDSKMFQVSKENRSPCDIQNDDTVFLCETLNSENVSKELLPRLVEKKFKNHLKYFKHKHLKLRNYDFAAKAIQVLTLKEHFYYHYYNSENDYFYIMDALDFKIIYFVKAPHNRTYFQSKRYVKRSSKFSKKCKI